MKPAASFFIAFRYLLGRAKEGGRYLRGAAAGIALSLVPIIVTLIVADGMIRGITDRYLELGTGHLQVDSVRAGTLEAAIPVMKDDPSVRGVWPERHGTGVIVGKAGKIGASIRAIEPSFWDDEGSRRYLEIIEGSSRPETDTDVLLGQDLARSMKVGIGDTVRIMTLRAGGGGRTIPRLNNFTVRGIVSAGYHELDSLWCIMTYTAGLRILDTQFSSECLVLKILDPYKSATSTALTLQAKLSRDYRVHTWMYLQRSQYSSYASTRQLLLFIMALVVMVAAVNVSSATSMLVIERQRDIAVLKAAGASPGGVTRLFLAGSFFTGLTGSVVGIGAGLLIGTFINELIHGLETILSGGSGTVRILDPGFYLASIPIIIDWNAIVLIGLFTLLSSIIASWIPARRAGKLKPLDIMRKY
ncbi:ABC transporter permease [Breznakiellaceae bacterium SP9]